MVTCGFEFEFQSNKMLNECFALVALVWRQSNLKIKSKSICVFQYIPPEKGIEGPSAQSCDTKYGALDFSLALIPCHDTTWDNGTSSGKTV